MPELPQLLLAHHARQVHVDQEQREAVVARVRVGLGDEHDEVGPVAVGDVGLRAVDDVLVAVAHRARLDARDVGARVGLGDAQAGDLLALDRRHEVGLLLLLGAEQVDRRRRHVRVHGDAHRQPAALGVRHLLGEHERAVVVAALAAVLLGVGQPEEAELAHAREDPVRERRLLPLLRVRAASSLTTKLWIDSRSCSCSSVKMKCRRDPAWSGFRTSVAAMGRTVPATETTRARRMAGPRPHFMSSAAQPHLSTR